MLSIKPTLIIDLISTFWILTIAIALLGWLPIQSITANQQPIDSVQILGLWLRTMTFILLGILSLSYTHLLNWLTMTLFYGGCLVFNCLKSYQWRLKDCQGIIHQKTLNLIDFLDHGLSLSDAFQKIKVNSVTTVQRIGNYLTNFINRRGIIFCFILTAILIFTFLLRWEYPLFQLRFTNPDRYSTLLVTRQLLTRNYPELNYFPVFSALIAMITLLGSIEPMQAIRFLSPIMGIALVMSVGYTVGVFTHKSNSVLIAMLALGGYLFTSQQAINTEPQWLHTIIDSLNNSLIRQWTGNELELGTIFLLLSLGYVFGSSVPQRRTITFKINLLCSIILVAISAPPLLIIGAIACIGLIGDRDFDSLFNAGYPRHGLSRKLTFTAIAIGWTVLAILAAMSQGRVEWMQSFLVTLPVALSMLTGILFMVVSDAIETFLPQRVETFCLGLIIALALNFCLPLPPNLTYLEYDLAARKTLEIKNIFPAKSWTLVAPVEQLAEVYGSGWYEDLALFVDKYGERANFDLSASAQDLFIMVEKVPFVTFPNEPDILPNELLNDRTYRYYRSTAGRASLEYEALQMCETYSRKYPNNSDIYYEDNELRIYHFGIAVDSKV